MTQQHLSNQAVIDYLKYYVAVDHKLDYAVLLDGPWGSGKTHLIKAFLEKRKGTGAKSLYVSLYGITSISQIEDEFYRMLHPILSSKGMRIASILTRSAAKGLLKLDFDGKSAGAEAEIAIPEIKLSDYLKGPADQLLIFDDLERCAIDVKDILGYINSFVEHDGMKVIILANEQEVKKKSAEYVLVKEKLIGQTLKVRSDTGSAYPHFLTTVSDARVQDLLRKERSRVLEIHTQSGSNNLRILQQSFWDFERLSMLFSEGNWKNFEGMQKLLELTLALSMEIRAGKIESDDLEKLTVSSLARYVRKKTGNLLV